VYKDFDKLVQKTSVYIIDWRDLSKIIKDSTGKEYDWLGMEQISNDSDHLYEADKTQYEENNEYQNLSDIINELCFNNVIPSGNYLVTVCW
jgi:hypothetical protein